VKCINKNKRFIKIPNNFFYSDGRLLNDIGGRNSFVLYCLITIRKNINDYTYLSIKEMNDLIYLDKNATRGYKKIRISLKLLRENGLIDFLDTDIDKDVVKLKWINLFPEKSNSGWIKFTYNDFDIFEVVGVDFYCVMWLLRMYTNHETKTSFIAISDIARLMSCKTVQIQRAVDFFEYAGLFKVKRGEYYKPKGFESDRAIKRNNNYKYTEDIEWILELNNY